MCNFISQVFMHTLLNVGIQEYRQSSLPQKQRLCQKYLDISSYTDSLIPNYSVYEVNCNSH